MAGGGHDGDRINALLAAGYSLRLILNKLRLPFARILTAYNFAKRLKTLKGLTPYEHTCKLWTVQPQRFTRNQIHHMTRLNR